MKIKEMPLVTQYQFTALLHIDDFMNVVVDSKEFDAFIIMAEKNGINSSLRDQRQWVGEEHKINIQVNIAHEFITQGFEYDLLTLLMENKN